MAEHPSNPSRTPGAATRTDKRRSVYVSALEQAEQLFTSAGEADYASRPLLLFYGLSQAGRAIAAAGKAPKGAGWELRSHGIHTVNLAEPLHSLHIVQTDQPDGSFTALSRLLGSPPIPTDPNGPGLTLGELWTTIPQAAERPLVNDAPAPLAFFVNDDEGRHPQVSGTLYNIPDRIFTSATPGPDLDRLMSHFPQAAGYFVPRKPDSTAPYFQRALGIPGTSVVIRWDTGIPDATPEQRSEALTRITTTFPGIHYLVPPVAGNDRPLHPLMAWWALLFALSMLACYEPAQWVAHLDVNASRHAVALEHVLDASLTAVPELIHLAIEQVS
ncbi:YaaC family protein [Kitasatospora sp. NPDC059827]|uniref:YaaC family protein n=1 Tax=Kitasatospora sp. NPDC059827 TaxID=3346964 RepID=UPI00364B66C1